jgi:hypothetical protein
MCEIEGVVQLITKLYIMVNATKLGWMVEIEDNKIILSKKSDLLTNLDKNTPQLINVLIQDAWEEE